MTPKSDIIVFPEDQVEFPDESIDNHTQDSTRLTLDLFLLVVVVEREQQ